jgi:hypothetical protein
MKLHNAQNGDTPLKIVHRLMTEDMGEQTPIDKARVANQLLSQRNKEYKPVDRIEDLSDAQLAELTGLILKGLYG